MPQRVAITGASGLIGGALSASLRPAATRSSASSAATPGTADEVRWDPANGVSWTRPPWTASTRWSTSPAPASATSGGPRRTSSRSSPPGSTARTTIASALADARRRGQAPVLVSGSAVGFYGRPRRRGADRDQQPGARVPLRGGASVGDRGRRRRPER